MVGRRRIGVAALGALLVAASVLAPPAQAQVAPPTAELSSTGHYFAHVDCDGQTVTAPMTTVGMSVQLDAPVAVDTEVLLGYAGELAGPDLPASVVVPAGRSSFGTRLPLSTPGTLVVTVLPGVGYVAGANLSLDIGPLPGIPGCELDEVTVRARVGDPLPDPYQPIDADLADTWPDLVGELPPGISGDAFGPLTGTLTTVGTFRFTMRWYVPALLTAYELRVTAIVTAADGPPAPSAPGPSPTPEAAPARPAPATAVPGSAAYTG